MDVSSLGTFYISGEYFVSIGGYYSSAFSKAASYVDGVRQTNNTGTLLFTLEGTVSQPSYIL